MLFTWERAHWKWFMWDKRFKDHFIRYNFAKDFTKDKIVLDIACWSWYWTNILSEISKEIIWMDISKEAIDFNNENYQLKNWNFVCYDWFNNPFENNYFDLIVSFETIEHIVEYENFLKELKRVLKNDWKLIISTPNFLWEVWKNKYHVSNFTHDKFIKVVWKYFNIEKVLFQWKHYYAIPWRGILEAILNINKDFNIYEERPDFEHHVSILICKK
ncbi:MAG: methyltransferase type 11 [uncultured bacterium (gcode 4)]|uniref:Methyltransferase type 11 n=1 Tax=uncultured bacterium (gcode 4) TaxID=1234023 RepID=K2AWY9_9BACT|nr:MAG: methyltransferase type 11 [uncultured bacterium (gcode 4)]